MWTASNKTHSGSALMMPGRASLTLLDMRSVGRATTSALVFFPMPKEGKSPTVEPSAVLRRAEEWN